jgi:hypothetical protein
MDTWSILQSFVIFYWTFGIVHGNLVYISRFGILYQEKSGNPDRIRQRRLGREIESNLGW